jgi:hypothetical protein
MTSYKRLALAVCDAACCGGPAAHRRALVALRDAAQEALDELDRPSSPAAVTVLSPPQVMALPPAVRDFWQHHADERGEVLLVLTRENRLDGEQDTLPYAVAEAGATSWERQNAERTVEPRARGAP